MAALLCSKFSQNGTVNNNWEQKKILTTISGGRNETVNCFDGQRICC